MFSVRSRGAVRGSDRRVAMDEPRISRFAIRTPMRGAPSRMIGRERAPAPRIGRERALAPRIARERAPALSSRFRDVARRIRDRERRKEPEEPEPSLEEKELRLAGRPGPISQPGTSSSGWKSILHDTFRRSFVSFQKGAFEKEELDRWWKYLTRKIKWEQPVVRGDRKLPRKAAWLTGGKCKCVYRYGGTAWPALEMEPWFLEMTQKVCDVCGITEMPNSCNANLYKNGTHSVGWHSDDEPLFAATRRDSLIISLSLGASRDFQICPNAERSDITTVRLRDGDLCTMEGMMQRHYRHRVPPERGVDLPRVNLTWRWVVRHDPDCPLHSENIDLPPATGVTSRKRARSPDLEEASFKEHAPKIARAPDPVEDAKRKKRLERFAADDAPKAQKTAEKLDDTKRLLERVRQVKEMLLRATGEDLEEKKRQAESICRDTLDKARGSLALSEIEEIEQLRNLASEPVRSTEARQTAGSSPAKKRPKAAASRSRSVSPRCNASQSPARKRLRSAPSRSASAKRKPRASLVKKQSKLAAPSATLTSRKARASSSPPDSGKVKREQQDPPSKSSQHSKRRPSEKEKEADEAPNSKQRVKEEEIVEIEEGPTSPTAAKLVPRSTAAKPAAASVREEAVPIKAAFAKLSARQAEEEEKRKKRLQRFGGESQDSGKPAGKLEEPGSSGKSSQASASAADKSSEGASAHSSKEHVAQTPKVQSGASVHSSKEHVVQTPKVQSSDLKALSEEEKRRKRAERFGT
eukprot:TRINITY_DN108350_c0_g1_i1.p1 TRINITY_DN108350_c0_g1~~TRINITY_DN108350_c0_g1_i1.p1  ORF type:complete len:752 (+),score=154.35 TRINITY_DN108350_c0_g1_i1:85-2340(+)